MRKSQREMILRHLESRKPLTSDAAWQNYGISKLATRVSELIYAGHKIKKTWISVPNRFGEEVRVVQYRM